MTVFLGTADPAGLFLSVLTLGELRKGVVVINNLFSRGRRLGAEQGAQGLNQRSPRRPARGPLHEHQHVGASARIAAAGRADADPEGIGRPASEARLEEGNGTPGAEFVLLCAFRKRAPQGRRGRESVVRFGRRGSSDHAVEPGRQIGPKRARPVAFRRRRGRFGRNWRRFGGFGGRFERSDRFFADHFTDGQFDL